MGREVGVGGGGAGRERVGLGAGGGRVEGWFGVGADAAGSR